MSKSLRLLREKHFELQKGLRDLGVLTILAYKSFYAQAWCKFCGLQVQKVLRTSQFLTILTSEHVWCKFWRLQLPKVLRACQSLTILTSKSLSRAGAVQILATSWQPILRTLPFLGGDFPSQRSHKTMEKHSISRNSYPPNPHVTHLCCITSVRSHLLVDRSSAATLSIVRS